MSVTWFLTPTPPETSHARPLWIHPESYTVALRQRWPAAVIHIPDPPLLLRWQLSDPRVPTNGGMEGTLGSDHQTVSFGFDDQDFYPFILWHRAYVSETIPLWLVPSYTDQWLAITPTTTATAIQTFIRES